MKNTVVFAKFLVHHLFNISAYGVEIFCTRRNAKASKMAHLLKANIRDILFRCNIIKAEFSRISFNCGNSNAA